MFQVQAPVVIVPSVEARAALGVQLRPAALAAWREIGAALDMAAAWPGGADAPADCWVAAVGAALELDPLAARLLALAVHYELDQQVERLFDALSECRGGPTTLHRDPGLIALLLGAPTAEVAARLAVAKLLGSGPLTLDRQGRLSPWTGWCR